MKILVVTELNVSDKIMPEEFENIRKEIYNAVWVNDVEIDCITKVHMIRKELVIDKVKEALNFIKSFDDSIEQLKEI